MFDFIYLYMYIQILNNYWMRSNRKWGIIVIYYLLEIIQKFWLVKSGGWNRHIRSVVAQIWSYDIIIEYWKHLYDLMTSH